jgi:23S rRNA pseudouridine2605 synthase
VARERLQKIMAASGLASRRGSEELIKAGRVMVDGRPATLGEQVDPELQRVVVDGRPLPAIKQHRAYWMLNKPAGVVSTVRDPHASRTVMELLPPEAKAQGRLYPIGRLDEESEGLLIFSNDGAWAELLLHPRYGVEREYMVGLARPLSREQKAALLRGIEMEEGLAKADMLETATPAQVNNLHLLLSPPHPELRWYRIVLAQGWKRQIRRMLDAVGQPVVRLVRVRVGSLKLKDLPAGEARELAHRDVTQLASCARRPTTTRPDKPARSVPAAQAGSEPAASDSARIQPSGALSSD